MPSNLTSHACFDSSGLIWASTYDGLIGYDGTRMHQYLPETHPGLAVNVVDYLYCDSRNRIWICSSEGLSLLDEHRRMKKITISDTLKNKDINGCIEMKDIGMLAVGPAGAYLLPVNKNNWEKCTWLEDTVLKGRILSRIWVFNNTSCMLLTAKNIMVADFATKKVIAEIPLKNITSLSKLNENELLAVGTGKLILYRINITKGVITKTYENLKDEKGNRIETQTISSEKGANGIVYITTRSAGLLGFDPAGEKLYAYTHHPLIKSSISSNSLRRIQCHQNGYMVITSTTGLNFTNVLVPSVEQRSRLVNSTGDVMDNIIMAGEDANRKIWVGSVNRIYIWDPLTDKATDISIAEELTGQANATTEAASIFRDDHNTMWVSYNGRGLAKFSSGGLLLKFLTKENNHLPTDRIRIIRQMQSGMLIIGAEDGFFMMNPETLQIDTFASQPLLKAISKKRVVNFFPDGDEIWIAASTKGAAYCYNFKNKTLKTFTPDNGLSSDRVYCIAKDQYGNIYVGTYDGLNIISPDGKIKYINKGNGLRNPRVDNIISDSSGRLWITNFSSLICYNPADKSFTYFDEQNGVSNAGFAVGQSLLTRDGKLLFCNNGLLIVDHRKPFPSQAAQPELIVNRMYDDGAYDLLASSDKIQLKYNDAKISFYYQVNTFIAANRFIYRYKMDGLDTGWQKPTKNNQVTYSLSPGTYVFHIQSSYNEGEWKYSKNKITVIVLPPWWQTLWFRVAAVALLAVVLFAFYRRRIKKIKDKAAIQQQITELESKALRAQMNPHFIFNSLNAIQELIVTKKVDEGYQYLSNFSKLLRQVLNNSEKNLIPLSSEIEMIKLQLSLESLRFKKAFSYTFDMDENIEPEMVNVPPLLLQPYVENAVWHGLRHKEGDKNLWIRIQETGQQLNIEIEDNGVGRQRSEEIKKNKLGADQFDSKGSALSEQRIKLLAGQYPGTATVKISDNKNHKGEATGTLVKIVLPSNLK